MGAEEADRVRQLSRLPIWVAPMAGGPSTPALVAAAAQAGAFGFLAAGYKTPDGMRESMEAVRSAGVRAFGVNLFVPGAPTGDPVVGEYLATLQPDAARLGARLGEPVWDDDHWAGKVAALVADPPAAVSFTFGCPPADVLASFAERGVITLVTVTSAAEARQAAAAGAGGLCVQGQEAGGHRGSFSAGPAGRAGAGASPPEDAEGSGAGAGASPPEDADGSGRSGPEDADGSGSGAGGEPGLRTLLADIAAVTDLPLVAAGGLAGPADVADVLGRGAVAAQLGTMFLRCPESGAHPLHKAALADRRFAATAVTRSFSGRPARGLVNQFMRDHPSAPAAYPEINNATRPLRAAAAAAGDPHRMSLWAGEGFRAAPELPVAEIVAALAEGAR